MKGLVGIKSHALTQMYPLTSYESERASQRPPIEWQDFTCRIIWPPDFSGTCPVEQTQLERVAQSAGVPGCVGIHRIIRPPVFSGSCPVE